MKKVIVSTDCALDSLLHDCDDSLALLYLLNNKDIDVAAIITTFGNTHEKNVFLSIKDLFLETGFSAKIIRGAKGRGDNCPEIIKFIDGLGKVDEYTLLSIGPLTNLQNLDENKLKCFKKIYVMGGTFKRGNVPPLLRAEFNFHKDHFAAEYIINSRTIELFPLETTREICLTQNVIEKVKFKWPKLGKKIQKLNDLSKIFLFHGSNPHDLIAATAITNPDLFEIKRKTIKLVSGQIVDYQNGQVHNVYDIKNKNIFYETLDSWANKL